MKLKVFKSIISQESTKDLNLLTLNSKNFLYCFIFLNNFKFLLQKKGLILCNTLLNVLESKLYITLNVFVQAFKCILYKRKSLKKQKNSIINNIKVHNTKIYNLFKNQLQFLKINLITLNIKILNKQVNTKIIIKFYHKLKKIRNILFVRRFNLFIDFIKINALFLESKVSLKIYTWFLSQIFKYLIKKKHNRYISFLKTIFQELIYISNLKKLKLLKSIKGFKSILKGRLQGKPRASSNTIQKGTVPIQSIDKEVSFHKVHIFTLYGVFGFKIWAYFQSN